MKCKVAIGGDHAGFEYKKMLTRFLEERGYEVQDFGPFSDASVDYPDHVHPLAKAINCKEIESGILICGSGNGVAMTANKYPQVRAALCWLPELAKLSREHNDANILCIPARFVDVKTAETMVGLFLDTKFEGGRHEARVKKISCQ